MSVPSGKAKRIAQYLATRVGEGNVFVLDDLRRLLPDTPHPDRPMRTLRRCGWVIRSYKDRAGLAPGQLYLERVGDPVWEDGYHWPSGRVPAAVRREVLLRDGSRCALCGIDFGDAFPDMPEMTATAVIAEVGGAYRAECQRCAGAGESLGVPGMDEVRARLSALTREEQKEILHWMRAGARAYSARDEAWMRYCLLDAETREAAQDALIDHL